MNKLYLLFGIVFLLSIGYAEAVCITPVDDLDLSSNNNITTLCNGTYYLNDVANDGLIKMSGSNVTLICNNTIIDGGNTSTSRGLAMGVGAARQNHFIYNCTFRNFGYNYYAQKITNLTFEGNKGYNSNKENFAGVSITNVIITNSIFDGSNYTAGHGIYISNGNLTDNVFINNITVLNMRDGACLQFNSVVSQMSRIDNITVKDSSFWNCTRGINDLASYNASYYNNVIGNMRAEGMKFTADNTANGTLGATNARVYNNIFYPNDYDWIQFYQKSQGIAVYNNTYINPGWIQIQYQINNTALYPDWNTSFTFEENMQPMYFKFATSDSALSSNAIVNFSYTGIKKVLFLNGNFTIQNQLSQYPFNDVKNTSNGVILASNVNNFTITLSPNQQIEVGDFTGGQCSIGENTRTGLLCIIGGCN